MGWRCRWRDFDVTDLAAMRPQLRKRVEKMLAKKNSATGNVTAVGEKLKSPAEDQELGAATPTLSSSRQRLYQRLEFRGVCMQNKAGIFPCPTVGTLLERGASLIIYIYIYHYISIYIYIILKRTRTRSMNRVKV
jgi:hypothetical protein